MGKTQKGGNFKGKKYQRGRSKKQDGGFLPSIIGSIVGGLVGGGRRRSAPRHQPPP
jgi:hypothetical protein